MLVFRDTSIIPGHGPRATKIDLERYRDVRVEVRDIVTPPVASGQAREELVAANSLGGLDEDRGGGFMNVETFTGIVFDWPSSGRARSVT